MPSPGDIPPIYGNSNLDTVEVMLPSYHSLSQLAFSISSHLEDDHESLIDLIVTICEHIADPDLTDCLVTELIASMDTEDEDEEV